VFCKGENLQQNLKNNTAKAVIGGIVSIEITALIDRSLPRLPLFPERTTDTGYMSGYIDLTCGGRHFNVQASFPFVELFRFYSRDETFGRTFGLQIDLPTEEHKYTESVRAVSSSPSRGMAVMKNPTIPKRFDAFSLSKLPKTDSGGYLSGVGQDSGASLFCADLAIGSDNPRGEGFGIYPFGLIGEVFATILSEPVFFLDLGFSRQVIYFVWSPLIYKPYEQLLAVEFCTGMNGDVRVEASIVDEQSMFQIGPIAPLLFGMSNNHSLASARSAHCNLTHENPRFKFGN
jgi:hypothetical protein